MVPPEVTLPEVDAIVVGASAGAVDALGVVLPALSADARVPVIVTVHLPPAHRSMLPEIFGPRCRVPVAQPFDKQPIERGIWFAAPDYHLLIESDRSFAMSIDEPLNYSRPAIDVLFESAAEVYRERLAAIVLTGASVDGARGAQRVREAGGFVVVQDPADAEIDVMPRAAIAGAAPQLVLPLARIAAVVKELALGGTGA